MPPSDAAPMTPYAGIGSRRSPPDVLELMTRLATALAGTGRYVCRTGGADNADQAFMAGVAGGGGLELYLPSQGFRRHDIAALRLGPLETYSGQQYVCGVSPGPRFVMTSPAPEAFDIASEYHGNWYACKGFTRSLLARDVHQILGPNLNPAHNVSFIVCWTPDGTRDGRGEDSGGTGMALRIASAYGVTNVFNLARSEDRERIERWVNDVQGN